MLYQKIRLKSGIKVGYRETFDRQLAEISSMLFEDQYPVENRDTYRLEIIKTKNNCKTYRLICGNEVYYLKKFFEKSTFIKIRNIFRTSKAFRCYSISHKLAAANIPVAEPLMYITSTKRLIGRESIFVTKEVAGTSLMEFLEQDISPDLREQVLMKLFGLLGHFYKNGFKHGDPGLYNYFIELKNGDYRITFLDLDVVHKFPKIPAVIALKSLGKMGSLWGHAFFVDKWSIYVKIFLDKFDPKINLDKAMD